MRSITLLWVIEVYFHLQMIIDITVSDDQAVYEARYKILQNVTESLTKGRKNLTDGRQMILNSLREEEDKIRDSYKQIYDLKQLLLETKFQIPMGRCKKEENEVSKIVIPSAFRNEYKDMIKKSVLFAWERLEKAKLALDNLEMALNQITEDCNLQDWKDLYQCFNGYNIFYSPIQSLEKTIEVICASFHKEMGKHQKTWRKKMWKAYRKYEDCILDYVLRMPIS